MIRVAIMYTAFAAGLAFALGSLHSCIDRMRAKAVTPEERVIPAREFKVDELPFPGEYELDADGCCINTPTEDEWRVRGDDGEIYYFTAHDYSGERVAL